MNFRDFFKFRKRVPVLIIERVQVGKRLFLFKKYTNKTLFVGNLSVLSILMIGLWSYMYYFGGHQYSLVQNELISICSNAKIDDVPYQVVDFFQKKGHLVIYVMTNRLQ
ncbi:MAG: hypothetical protein ACLPY5_09345 [Candidatus Bathyarchaeia archaeon]